jgi:hypothetical protein
MTAANTLIMNCQVSKKIDQFVNKMFKMADGYMTEYNKSTSQTPISRNIINLTYENFRKKKEAAAATMGAAGQQPGANQMRASQY